MRFLNTTEEACAVVIFDKSGVKYHFRSKSFENQKYWVSSGPLNSDTFAYDVANGKIGSLAMSDVSFDAWVDISEKPEWVRSKLSDKCIKEQTMWFSNLDRGLSLLWAKDKSLIWN